MRDRAEPDESEFIELDPRNPRDFEELVREALDDLPDLLLKALDHVAVVISDKGRRHRAYGLYQGDTAARDNYPDRIIIFRDTLLRDFGDDPDALERRRIHWPTGRLAKPREIVNAALFLASDDASFATGAPFIIDGGWTAQSIAEHAIPAMKAGFYGLDRSQDVFSWDPV